tara:strand:- start:273 stop:653 length:381 start_codon:yes stop_codon:yes gene_type:complete
MKISQVALFLVIFAMQSGETNAFIKRLFNGDKNKDVENKVGGKGGKNKGKDIVIKQPDNTAADNIINGFAQNGDENQLKSMIITIANKSIEEEAKKFEEALIAVMAQRTKEYIKVKLGRDDDKKVN